METMNDPMSSTFIDEENATEQPRSPSRAESAIEALKKLANSDYAIESASTSRFITDTLGVDSDASQTLEQRIKTYQRKQEAQIADYLNAAEQRLHNPDNCLCILDGWEAGSAQDPSLSALAGNLLTCSTKKTTGGFFLCWNGTGIAINPGTNFLTHFHQQGLHVRDIDCVIVTRNTPDTFCDVEAIYQLNYQLNSQNPTGDLHIIRYFLNQQAHQDLSSRLKPNFKQERNTVHCLELFLDSPEVEKVDLCQDITLNYFQNTAAPESNRNNSTIEERSSQQQSCLGIRLECKGSDKRTMTSVGYIGGVAWSPLIAHNLGRCDLLITAFDNTRPSDYGKVQYNEECLGYFGTFSLLEEVAPRIQLCCEYGGREGDVRLEVVKKMRQEYAYSQHQGTTILPGDIGLHVDLKALQIRCSITQKMVDPSQVRLVKTADSFGRLQYLSPSCFC